MTVEMRHLRSFVVLADELHFRRAARRLSITQPALSHQIADLEARLEVELLSRDQRHVALTQAGELLRDQSRELIEAFDKVIENTRRAGSGVSRRLVIGQVEYVTQQFMPLALRDFHRQHPEVVIELREMHYAEVIAALAERTIDVGITQWPLSEPSLAARAVAAGQWSVVVPKGHRLAELDEVPVRDLEDEPLVVFARHLNPTGHDWLLSELGLTDEDPRIVHHTGQASSGPDLVAQGLGLFIVSSYVLGKLRDDVVLKPLSGFARDTVLAAAWRSDDTNPPLRDFLDHLPKVKPPKTLLWNPDPKAPPSKRSGRG